MRIASLLLKMAYFSGRFLVVLRRFSFDEKYLSIWLLLLGDYGVYSNWFVVAFVYGGRTSGARGCKTPAVGSCKSSETLLSEIDVQSGIGNVPPKSSDEKFKVQKCKLEFQKLSCRILISKEVLVSCTYL